MTGNKGEGALHPPPRIPATAFPRPRLCSRLDAWADITVVHGPVGSGKTTLLAAWSASVDAPVAWCEPGGGRLPFDEIERFAAAGSGVLIVDCGERLDGEEFGRLGRLVDRSPRLRLVVATRSARTARELAASSDAALDVIGPGDLLVTPEELLAAGLDEDEERSGLLRRSDGLVVAVRSELETGHRGVPSARERLRRRLRAELEQREGAYEVLLRIALLPRVDRAILAAWGISEGIVGELDAVGIVEWDGDWVGMHPYLGEVFAEDAEQRLSAAERSAFVAAAVRASLIRRDPSEGLRAAFAVGDLTLATEVVLANMVELLEARDSSYAIFHDVPVSRLRGFPALILTLILLSNMDPDTRPRAVRLLAVESLFQRVQPNRGLHRERVLYRAFEAAALRLTPFSSRALPLIRRALDDFLALEDEEHESLGRMGPMLLVHLGIGAFYAGEFELAEQCFDLADAKHAEAGRNDRVDPLSLRGGLAALNGDLPRARRLLAEADAAEWPPGWRGSSPADFLNLGMAVLALEDGDPDAAERHLAAAGPIADIVEHWPLYALVRARRDRLAGEIESGLLRLRLLRERRGPAPGTPLAKSLLDVAEAELRLSAGQPEQARSLVLRSAKHSGSARTALARTELALDHPSAATTQAQRVLRAEGTTLRCRLEAELVLACAALRTGHRDDAGPILERILTLIRITGMRAPLRTVALRDRAPLMDALVEAGADESIVQHIGTELSPAEQGLEPAPVLTRRERAVLLALAEVRTVEAAAERLFVSPNTVKSQLRSVYRKLGVSTRKAALERAAVLGLLEDPPVRADA